MGRIIVEGLDGTGKTMVAKYLAEFFSLKYLKIKKGANFTGGQEHITRCIVNEISDKLGNWDGILDRGFYSAIGTGLCLDPNMNTNRLYIPDNLVGTTNILVTSSIDTIVNRCKRDLTIQDKSVLFGGVFEYAQDWMINNMPKEYIRINNDFNDEKKLNKLLAEKVLYSYTDNIIYSRKIPEQKTF